MTCVIDGGNMNNYCTNCGKKLDKNELKCSDCGVSNVKDFALIKNKQHSKGNFGVVIILLIVFMVLICVLIKSSPKYKIESYIKNSLNSSNVELKYQGRAKCTGKCIIPLDGCLFAETVSGCNIYYYRVNLDKRFLFDAKLTYKSSLGISDNDIQSIMWKYDEVKNDINKFLEIDEFIVDFTDNKEDVILPINLSNNLNEVFLKKIILYSDSKKEGSYTIDLLFDDNYTITINPHEIKVYFDKDNYGNISIFSTETDSKIMLEELKQWMKQNR